MASGADVALAEISADALLLRRIPYGDTSLILHIVAERHGRLSLMARGARRANSPLRALVEPLFHLRLRWRAGRTGMGTLLDAERGACLLPETHHLAGLEVLSVAARLFGEGEVHGYAELRAALVLLAVRPPDSGLLAAVWSLLDAGGWLGALDHCWACGRKDTDMRWSQGQLRCAACGGGRKVSPGLIRGIRGHMRSPRVYLPAGDLNAWRGIVQDTLQAHGFRPLQY